MTAFMVNDEVVSRLVAVAAPKENITALVEAAMLEFAAHRERLAAGRAEMQALKYGWSDLSHLSGEELEEQGDLILAALPPEKVAEAKRLGLVCGKSSRGMGIRATE